MNKLINLMKKKIIKNKMYLIQKLLIINNYIQKVLVIKLFSNKLFKNCKINLKKGSQSKKQHIL